MRNLNNSKLVQEVIADLDSYISPLEFVLDCGWDKNDYDKWAVKFNAGLLKDWEQELFKEIYVSVQRILSRIEKSLLDGSSKNNNGLTILAMWNPVAYGDSKKQLAADETANRYARIKTIPNTSPVELLNDK